MQNISATHQLLKYLHWHGFKKSRLQYISSRIGIRQKIFSVNGWMEFINSGTFFFNLKKLEESIKWETRVEILSKNDCDIL